MHNELHLCCVINVKIWFLHDLGFTGFNHFSITDRGGGVAAYLRTDIVRDRQKDYECKHIESISVEVNLQNSKILICGAYKPPSMTDNIFENDCSLTLDKISSKYDNYILLGDLNFDMLCEQKCSSLMNICDIFDLENLLKKPTCYTSNNNPSLVRTQKLSLNRWHLQL